MQVGPRRGEVAMRVLLSDPGEEGLQLWRGSQGRKVVVEPGELRVGIRRVQLLVARPAKRRAVLGLATLLLGFEMVEGNQVPGNAALAEGAGGESIPGGVSHATS